MFTENKNTLPETRELIQAIKTSTQLYTIFMHYENKTDKCMEDICLKLDKYYPQAEWDWNTRDMWQYVITATLKKYKTFTEEELKDICEKSNTTLISFDNQEAVFHFDDEGYFEKEYNMQPPTNTKIKEALKNINWEAIVDEISNLEELTEDEELLKRIKEHPLTMPGVLSDSELLMFARLIL